MRATPGQHPKRRHPAKGTGVRLTRTAAPNRTWWTVTTSPGGVVPGESYQGSTDKNFGPQAK
jgi:hypothetical protein